MTWIYAIVAGLGVIGAGAAYVVGRKKGKAQGGAKATQGLAKQAEERAREDRQQAEREAKSETQNGQREAAEEVNDGSGSDLHSLLTRLGAGRRR